MLSCLLSSTKNILILSTNIDNITLYNVEIFSKNKKYFICIYIFDVFCGTITDKYLKKVSCMANLYPMQVCTRYLFTKVVNHPCIKNRKERNEMKTNTYDAFISYKQNSDIKTAKSLARSLEHFHIPSEFQEKIGKKRFKIFRDKDELRTSSNLSAELKEALKNSKYLIVICSPAAKTAPSVLKEIKYFLQTHGNSKKNIITVLAKGEPKDAIPNILIENKHDENYIEPFAADYRKYLNRSQELPRIAATLIDCSYDELVQRNRSYERTKIGFRVFIIVATAIIFTRLYTKGENNHENALREESENLVFTSENAYSHHDKEKALETALEALPSKGNKRPYIPEAKQALLTATDAYKFEEDEIEVIKNFNLHVPIQEYAVYTKGEGKYIAILGKDTSLHAYNIKTGEEVLDATPVWHESGTSPESHIMMCDENQLIFCSSTNITSFDLDKKDISWHKNLKIDSSFRYINLSYNSDIITVGLKSGEIILLDKKSGVQADSVILNDMITKTQEDKQIFAKISPDGRYMICRNKSCIYLYDRNEKSLLTISDGLQSEYAQIDEQIMGNYYIFVCTNGEKKDIHILCYDMVNKKIAFEKEQEQKERNMYIPRLIPLENVTINGKIMDITLCVIGNSMSLIDCRSGKIMSKITYTNQIKGAFLQKYNSNFSKHDYGILPSGYDEDLLTVIFENGECADYSFLNENTSASYKVFENGVIYPEKTEDYFLISYKNNSNEAAKDNIVYGLNFNIHTHKDEFFADGIFVYGKMQTNTDWQKITDDYDDYSNAYPYKNGFLIFQNKSCIYYDVKKESVIWENQDINHINEIDRQLLYNKGFWMQKNRNFYEYLGMDASEKNILIGNFSEDLSYKIQFLNGENGKATSIDELNLESFNNTPYKIQEISDFLNSNGKIYFAVKLEGIHGLIISYDLASEKHLSRKIELKNSSSSIKISSVSHNGQYIFWCEQKEDTLYLDECVQSAILDMENEKLYSLWENIPKNIMLIPNPCWTDTDEYFALRSNNQILILSKTGDYEYAIETKEYTFVGFVFVDNILYVIGELNGTPMLYRYAVQSGELMDSSELKGRSGFCGNTFDIECIKTFDSEVIMILHYNRLLNDISMSFKIGVSFHNAYIINQPTGKSIAFVQQGAAYNPDIDYLFANQGIVKRYTTEELIKKASKIKEIS